MFVFLPNCVFCFFFFYLSHFGRSSVANCGCVSVWLCHNLSCLLLLTAASCAVVVVDVVVVVVAVNSTFEIDRTLTHMTHGPEWPTHEYGVDFFFHLFTSSLYWFGSKFFESPLWNRSSRSSSSCTPNTHCRLTGHSHMHAQTQPRITSKLIKTFPK